MVSNLDGLRFLLGTALLAYAVVTDVRTRRVRNMTWIVGSAIGIVLLLGDYVLGRPVEWLPLALAVVVIVAAYALWYFHLIAGGADAKAIMTLAVLMPFPIAMEWGARVYPLWTSPLPPAFVAFANSLLAFLVIPLAFLVLNVIRGDVRFPHLLLGYRVPIDAADKGFVWVMERVDAAGQARSVLFSSKLSREQQAQNLESLRAAGRTRVWVTPKIPFMVPLLLGFVATFLIGDVFTRLILIVMGRSP